MPASKGDRKSTVNNLSPSSAFFHDKLPHDDSSGSFSHYDMSFISSPTPEIDVAWSRAERHVSTKQKVRSFFQNQVDSFKRDNARNIMTRSTPLGSITPGTFHPESGHERIFDQQAAAHNTAISPLIRRLKGRHLQMIAIGGSIGTGLFVSSGKALSDGGPANVLIAYSVIGLMLYCTVHALGEMAVAFPVAGSFSAYSTRFLDPAWGFAMGWNYALQWLVTLPLETVSATITVQYWTTSINNSAWVTIFLVFIVAVNLFGVKGYGEAEFVMGIVKITAIIGFIILGVIINIGGGTDGSYIGGMYWRDPGAFNNGFKGLCSTLVTAAFAYAGTELVGLAAAETANPRKTLPKAIKQVFWRITLFYIVSLMLIGLCVRSDDPRLLGSADENDSDTHGSPFVIAIINAGIQGLDSVMNTVILVAVLSVANASAYGSSRTLAAMAEQGQAPRILAYIDRRGRPVFAILLAMAVGLLAYLAASPNQQDIFYWLLSISGLSSILTWGSICLSHIRFRAAWHHQGHRLEELAFVSHPGLIGSWVGLLINAGILVAQFWTGAWPIGYEQNTTQENIINFFQVYLALPFVLCCYIPYKIWYRTPFMRVSDMDLHTGMRELNVMSLLAEERKEKREWPTWKRWYNLFC